MRHMPLGPGHERKRSLSNERIDKRPRSAQRTQDGRSGLPARRGRSVHLCRRPGPCRGRGGRRCDRVRDGRSRRLSREAPQLPELPGLRGGMSEIQQDGEGPPCASNDHEVRAGRRGAVRLHLLYALRGAGMRERVPRRSHHEGCGRRRVGGQGTLHRVQVLPPGLPLRRSPLQFPGHG